MNKTTKRLFKAPITISKLIYHIIKYRKDSNINYHKLFEFVDNGTKFIGVIRYPDTGYPHFRIYKNKISPNNYFLSIYLRTADYFSYTDSSYFSSYFIDHFRNTKSLTKSQIIKMIQCLTSEKYAGTTVWEYAVDLWFSANVEYFECIDMVMPNYNHLKERVCLWD